MGVRKEAEVVLTRPSANRLKDKVVLITGATSGIGKACAILFAYEGAKVAICGRRKEKGEAVLKQIRDSGGEGIFIQADVTVEEDCQRIVRETMDAYGRIDCLFNNAGRLITKPTVELTRQDWEDFTNLDCYSYLRMMQLVLPIMEAQGGGSIVNDTSLAALDNQIPGGALYCFTKAGVNHMTHCIAVEYCKKNIRINNVMPGLIATEMTLEGPGAEGYDYIQSLLPVGRAADPLEVAYPVLFLLSDEASYISGASLLIDYAQRGY
ncbi:MAG: SDR family oxidoreductase [Solobacterium sp.]|nr:SDR family oxidoreductase [Solobacterium sp.]